MKHVKIFEDSEGYDEYDRKSAFMTKEDVNNFILYLDTKKYNL